MSACLERRNVTPTNRVQFQMGLSLGELMITNGTEEQSRRPKGFARPLCGDTRHRIVARDGCSDVECGRCRHRAAMAAGMIAADTKLPLRRCFLAMRQIIQAENNVLAREPMRHLGVGSGRRAVECGEFKAVNPVLGNPKAAINRTYHAFDCSEYGAISPRPRIDSTVASICLPCSARLLRAADVTAPWPEPRLRMAEGRAPSRQTLIASKVLTLTRPAVSQALTSPQDRHSVLDAGAPRPGMRSRTSPA